jgi:hypothetical protein
MMNQVQFIGDIPGTFFDKSGNYVQSSTLRQVSFSRDSIFNLLSFPQLMMQGWSIVGASLPILMVPLRFPLTSSFI